jgi:CRP-like cAMP-binding protein
MPLIVHAQRVNSLLAAAADDFAGDIERVSETVDHTRGDELFREGDRIDEIYFPLSGVISLTIDTSQGQTVEVAIIGAEGMAGVSRFLGTSNADSNAVVQVAGAIAHVPADHVIRWATQSAQFRARTDHFLRSFMVELAQSGVCNQLHSVEQRTSRWLLHASDRARMADMHLTHEFLAQMLAVRRSSVTNVVGIFARAGLITTQRGLISIADTEGLRGFACECYEIVRAATSA